MIATPAEVAVPLRTDEDGVIRVGTTRVSLQSLIADYQRGASPEQIVQHFPVLTLADVYAVVAYYLRNPSPVDEYIEQQRWQYEQARADYEAAYPTQPTRAQLLARLSLSQAEQQNT